MQHGLVLLRQGPAGLTSSSHTDGPDTAAVAELALALRGGESVVVSHGARGGPAFAMLYELLRQEPPHETMYSLRTEAGTTLHQSFVAAIGDALLRAGTGAAVAIVPLRSRQQQQVSFGVAAMPLLHYGVAPPAQVPSFSGGQPIPGFGLRARTFEQRVDLPAPTFGLPLGAQPLEHRGGHAIIPANDVAGGSRGPDGQALLSFRTSVPRGNYTVADIAWVCEVLADAWPSLRQSLGTPPGKSVYSMLVRNPPSYGGPYPGERLPTMHVYGPYATHKDARCVLRGRGKDAYTADVSFDLAAHPAVPGAVCMHRVLGPFVTAAIETDTTTVRVTAEVPLAPPATAQGVSDDQWARAAITQLLPEVAREIATEQKPYLLAAATRWYPDRMFGEIELMGPGGRGGDARVWGKDFLARAGKPGTIRYLVDTAATGPAAMIMPWAVSADEL